MTVHHWILLNAPAAALTPIAMSYLLLIMGGASSGGGGGALTDFLAADFASADFH